MIALAVYSLALLIFGWRLHDLAQENGKAEAAKTCAGFMLAGIGGLIVSIIGFIVKAVWS
jgi:hypothetical protein